MRGFVAYAAPILSFVAALVALLGPSRKPDMTGVASLTAFGWAAGGFALIALMFTLYNAKSQQDAIRQAQAQLTSMRRVAQSEFQDGTELILNILRFAALMRYTTIISPGPEDRLPYENATQIDLRGQRTLDDLATLRLDPTARLGLPFIPSAVPFSPSSKPVMSILMEQSSNAIAILENALQIYSAKVVDAEVMEAASVLARDPFLKRLTTLDAEWRARSEIEDSATPAVVGLYFLGKTSPNPAPDQYLELLDRVDRLRAALDALVGKK